MLRINDKDYSITFSCYFNVEWPEKRLRLDSEFGREQVRKSRLSSTLIDFLWRSFTFLLTGGTGCQYHGKSRHYSANEPGVCQGAVAAQHLHLQPQNLQGNPKQSMIFQISVSKEYWCLLRRWQQQNTTITCYNCCFWTSIYSINVMIFSLPVWISRQKLLYNCWKPKTNDSQKTISLPVPRFCPCDLNIILK